MDRIDLLLPKISNNENVIHSSEVLGGKKYQAKNWSLQQKESIIEHENILFFI